MNKKNKNIIKTFLFITIGIVLFYLVYKDFDIDSIINEAKKINYLWIIPMFIVSVLSHISRSLRWRMLLNSDGSKVSFINTFLAVLNGYFANLAIPRLGEVTRCAIISKYEKQNFSKVLGTMVTERLTDIIVLLIMTILTIGLQTSQIAEFINNNPNLGANIEKLTSLPMLISFGILGISGIFFLIFLLKGKFDNIKILKKLSDFIKNFFNGIISIKNIKNPIKFIFHSFFIWSMYFITLYIFFFAYEGFSDLGILAALFVFIAGSFGMVAPAPNGVGAYHFMTIQALLIYGVAEEKAATFALIVHGVQTLILVVAGFISFILVPIVNKDK